MRRRRPASSGAHAADCLAFAAGPSSHARLLALQLPGQRGWLHRCKALRDSGVYPQATVTYGVL
jgi:hypothetical protein